MHDLTQHLKWMANALLLHYRRKGGGVRLEELADMLRLAFSTAEPSAPGRRAATLGYRVHIHKERAMSRGESPILHKTQKHLAC